MASKENQRLSRGNSRTSMVRSASAHAGTGDKRKSAGNVVTSISTLSLAAAANGKEKEKEKVKEKEKADGNEFSEDKDMFYGFPERLQILRTMFSGQHVQYLKEFEVKSDIRCMAQVGESLWVGTRGGSIQIRDYQGLLIGEVKAQRPDQAAAEVDKFFVNAIYRNGDKVWVGSSDGYLRAYDVDGIGILFEGAEHTGGVKAICGNTDFVWSSSEDFTILQRESGYGTFVKQLVGHTSWVGCLVVNPLTGHLWSGSLDGIRIWDPTPPPEEEKHDPKSPSSPKVSAHRPKSPSKSEEDHVHPDCLYLLKGHEDAVTKLLVVDDKIWSGCADGAICIWDAKDRTLIKKIGKSKKSPIIVMELIDQYVWTATYDREIQVWHRKTGDLFDTLKVDSKGKISCIAYYYGRVWIGTRNPGIVYLYRVYDPFMTEKINKRVKPPRVETPEPVAEPEPVVVAAEPEPEPEPSEVEEEIDTTLLSTEELVELYNKRQTDTRFMLHAVGDGFYMIGTRKVQLVALQGHLMVRVGGGYITIEEFVVRIQSSIIRQIKMDNIAALSNESKTHTVVKMDGSGGNGLVSSRSTSSQSLTGGKRIIRAPSAQTLLAKIEKSISSKMTKNESGYEVTEQVIVDNTDQVKQILAQANDLKLENDNLRRALAEQMMPSVDSSTELKESKEDILKKLEKERSFCNQLILTLAQTRPGLECLGEVNPGMVTLCKARLTKISQKPATSRPATAPAKK